MRNPANKPNWTSYLRSQLVPQNEYNFIMALEGAKSKQERDEVLGRDKANSARCIINLITEVAKDQLIRYVLTVFDDLLQVRGISFYLRKLFDLHSGISRIFSGPEPFRNFFLFTSNSGVSPNFDYFLKILLEGDSKLRIFYWIF